MIIYCARNIKTDKMYVGKTTKTLDERKLKHLDAAKHNSETYFHKALRDNEFEWTVLEEVAPGDDSNLREQFWISKLDTHETGYNMTKGGDGGLTYRKGTELYKKIKHKLGKWKNGNPGANPESRSKAISTVTDNIQSGIYFSSGKEHGNYKGKFLEKHKNYKGGPAPTNAKRVCINGIEYDSLRAAARAYNICAETVANRCNKLNYLGWEFI